MRFKFNDDGRRMENPWQPLRARSARNHGIGLEHGVPCGWIKIEADKWAGGRGDVNVDELRRIEWNL